jgi:hypothetical protein
MYYLLRYGSYGLFLSYNLKRHPIGWEAYFIYHTQQGLSVLFIFGWRALPALFLAELWGPDFNILVPSSLINIFPSLLSVLSVPMALQTLHMFDFSLGNTQESPLNKRNYKHIALITLISAFYNSLLVNFSVSTFLLSAPVGIDRVIRFFVGDILGTATVLILLALMLNPIFRTKS